MKLLYVLLCATTVCSCYGYKKLSPGGYRAEPTASDPQVLYEWKVLDFGFPSEAAKRDAEAKGNLVATNSMPIDVQPHYHSKYTRVAFYISGFGNPSVAICQLTALS